MATPEVSHVRTPSGNALKVEERPDGPLFLIHEDGRIVVNRGPYDDVGRMFWDAVAINGETYREKIARLEETIATLMLDPYREAVHGDSADVWSEIPKVVRPPLVDVTAVLDAVNRIAIRRVQ